MSRRRHNNEGYLVKEREREREREKERETVNKKKDEKQWKG